MLRVLLYYKCQFLALVTCWLDSVHKASALWLPTCMKNQINRFMVRQSVAHRADLLKKKRRKPNYDTFVLYMIHGKEADSVLDFGVLQQALLANALSGRT